MMKEQGALNEPSKRSNQPSHKQSREFMEEMQFYVHFTPDKINEEDKQGTLKRQKDKG